MTSLKVVNKPNFEAERMHVDFDMFSVCTLKTVEQLWFRQYFRSGKYWTMALYASNSQILLSKIIGVLDVSLVCRLRRRGIETVRTIVGGKWKILQDNKTIMDFLEGISDKWYHLLLNDQEFWQILLFRDWPRRAFLDRTTEWVHRNCLTTVYSGSLWCHNENAGLRVIFLLRLARLVCIFLWRHSISTSFRADFCLRLTMPWTFLCVWSQFYVKFPII